MALTECPECNKEISDKATSCPNCGNPIKKVSTAPVIMGKLAKELLGDEIQAAKRIGKAYLSFTGRFIIIITTLIGLTIMVMGIDMLIEGVVEGLVVLFVGIVFCAGAYYLWYRNKHRNK